MSRPACHVPPIHSHSVGVALISKTRELSLREEICQPPADNVNMGNLSAAAGISVMAARLFASKSSRKFPAVVLPVRRSTLVGDLTVGKRAKPFAESR